jgi:hypothetical protein
MTENEMIEFLANKYGGEKIQIGLHMINLTFAETQEEFDQRLNKCVLDVTKVIKREVSIKEKVNLMVSVLDLVMSKPLTSERLSYIENIMEFKFLEPII